MKIPLPSPILQLGRQFSAAGYRLYAVGGLVRNTLLGNPPSDWDTCTDALPEASGAIGHAMGLTVVPKAVQFGTVEFLGSGAGQDGRQPWSSECTTFRRDTYGRDGSHRPDGVHFSTELSDDAFRRDFSINALYADALTGEVIDPTGGLADLENRLIRTTSPDPDRILQDDGLRILRLVRFACELGFSIEPATFAAARRHAHGLKDIPAERIYSELCKILLSDARYHAPQPGGESAPFRGIRLLYEMGALECILPELLEGVGVEQNPLYHAHDVFWHSLHTLACSPPSLPLRFAALLHDVAKPRCVRETGRMLGHDEKGALMADEILLRLKAPKALREEVCLLVRRHMYDLDGRAKESTLRRQFVRWGAAFTLRFAQLREADFVGSGIQPPPVVTAERARALIARMQAEGVPFSLRELAVSGRDLQKELGLEGPVIGETLLKLQLHCAVRPRENRPEQLLRVAKRFLPPDAPKNPKS